MSALKSMEVKNVFGPTREEETGERRKSCNEDFQNLSFSPNINQEIRPSRILWGGGGYVALIGGRKKCIEIFMFCAPRILVIIFVQDQVTHCIYLYD
jgi:hypothetical protein